MIQNDGDHLAVIPYDKKDFISHRVPAEVYAGSDALEINSVLLCRMIAKQHQWEKDCSYRVPGIVLNNKSAAIFNLKKAEVI